MIRDVQGMMREGKPAAYNHVPTFLFALQHPDNAVTVALTNTLLVSMTNAFVATENTNGELLVRHTNTLTDGVTTLHYTMGGTPTLQAIDPLTGNSMLDDTYHLQEGSDAIDAGVDVARLVDAGHDLDGQVRPWGLGPDIGADEFVLVAPETADISGPAEGIVGRSYTFTATYSPGIAEPPISYTWTPEPDAVRGWTWRSTVGTRRVPRRSRSRWRTRTGLRHPPPTISSLRTIGPICRLF